jgi:MFS transporter, PPP family, 3-phenylpropionic acid transporter
MEQTDIPQDACSHPAMVKPGQLSVRLAAMHGINFTAFGLYLPFFPLWLTGLGFSSSQVALVAAASTAVRIVSTPLVSMLGDGRLGPVRLMAIVQMIVGFLWIMLGGLSGAGHADLAAVMVVMCLLSAAWSGVVPLADVVTTGHVRVAGLDYGRIRVWGSVTFLLASVLGGWLAEHLGIAGLPWWLALSAAASVMVLAAIPAPQRVLPSRQIDGRPAALSATLICVMLGSAAIQSSHGMMYAFGSIHWAAIGHSNDMIGVFWASSVAAEIILFFAIGRGLANVRSSLRLLLIGGVFAAVRFAIVGSAVSVSAILATQVLHALSFGATHLGMIGVVSALAPSGRAAQLQGMTAGLHAGCMAVAMLGSGALYTRFAGMAFLGMVPIAMIGAGLITLAMLFNVRAISARDASLTSSAGSTGGLPPG